MNKGTHTIAAVNRTREELQWAYLSLQQFERVWSNELAHLSADSLAEERILAHVAKLANASFAQCYVANRSSDTLTLTATFATTEQTATQTTFAWGEGIPGQVAKMQGVHAVATSEGFHTFLPVCAKEKVYGVIGLGLGKLPTELEEEVWLQCLRFFGYFLAEKEALAAQEHLRATQASLYEKLVNEREELDFQKDAIRHNYERLQQLRAYEERIEALEGQLNQRTAAPPDRTADAKWEARIEALQAQIYQLRQALTEAERTQVVPASQEVPLADVSQTYIQHEEYERIQQENTRLQAEILSLRKTQEQAQKALENLPQATTDATPAAESLELQERWKTAKEKYIQQQHADAEKIASLQRKVQELTEALRPQSGESEQEILQKKVSDMEEKLRETEEKLAAASRQADTPLNKSDRLPGALIAQYEKKIQDFADKFQQYRKEVSQAHAEEVATYQRELEALRQQLAAEQRAQPDTDTLEAQTARAALEKEVQQLRETLQAREAELAHAKAAASLPKEVAQANEKNSEVLEYEHRLSQALQDIQAYAQKLQEAERTISELQSRSFGA